VSDYTDILNTLKIVPLPQNQKNEENFKIKISQNLAQEEKQVYDSLTFDAVSFDMLLDITNIEPGKLHLTCMGLELKGLARKLPGNRYIRGI